MAEHLRLSDCDEARLRDKCLADWQQARALYKEHKARPSRRLDLVIKRMEVVTAPYRNGVPKAVDANFSEPARRAKLLFEAAHDKDPTLHSFDRPKFTSWYDDSYS